MLTGFQGFCTLMHCFLERGRLNGRTMLHAAIVCVEAGAGEHARHLEVKPQTHLRRVAG